MCVFVCVCVCVSLSLSLSLSLPLTLGRHREWSQVPMTCSQVQRDHGIHGQEKGLTRVDESLRNKDGGW